MSTRTEPRALCPGCSRLTAVGSHDACDPLASPTRWWRSRLASDDPLERAAAEDLIRAAARIAAEWAPAGES